MLLTNKNELIHDKKQLSEIFFSGCKTEEKIGIESEKLLVDKDSQKAIEYSRIVELLEKFDSHKWEKVYQSGNLLGLKSDLGTISLEPGSQVELSLKPIDNLDEISSILKKYYDELDKYSDEIDAKVLNIGAHCVSTYQDINIIPKERYKHMTKYLPTKGLEPFVMMRETAGIQVNFDYKSEQDAIRKLSLATKMSPFISSIYANSPIRNSKLNGYKSFRANSWLNVDEDRCGYINKKLFEKDYEFSFNDYVETLLDVPMIFIERDNVYYPTNQTFRQFMQNGLNGIRPQKSDWQTHLSLYFPDVRLKNYIEIRNHDAQNFPMTLSVFAFWKSIIYNPNAMEEIEKIMSKFEYSDFMELRQNTPKYAINTKIKNYTVLDFVKEFFNIAYFSLKETDEEDYLDCIWEYISMKKVPADDFVKEFFAQNYL